MKVKFKITRASAAPIESQSQIDTDHMISCDDDVETKCDKFYHDSFESMMMIGRR